VSGRSRGLPLASLIAGLVLTGALVASFGAPRRLLSLLSPSHAPHLLDGRLAPGEYRFQWTDETSKLRFAWSIAGDRLLGAIQTPDTGWVAIGFGGSGPLMYGADIVIGHVDAHGARVHDHFADTPTSHQPDTALGGHNDVLGAAGLQTAAGTTIEFERSLAAHDSTDHAIEAGQTHIIMASSEEDDFTAYHISGRKAVALLDLFSGPPAAAGSRGGILPDHLTDVQIFLAAWAALLLVIGVHSLIETMIEGGTGLAAGAPVPATAAASILTLVIVELAALATFGTGVVLTAPTWVLGLSLAIGLLALAGLIAAYSRATVRWDLITRERDDGIPW
jgi:hypothetical protein